MSCLTVNLLRITTCLALLSMPVQVYAGRYQPADKWTQSVRTAEPFLQYRLGVVEFKDSTGDEWLEYMADLRATLRAANYFQTTSAPRLRLQIERTYLSGETNSDGCKTTPGTLALTYHFLDGEREVNRIEITTQAPVSGSNNNFDAAMAGNLKYLLLELRKMQGEAEFAAQATTMANDIQQTLGGGSNLGCTVGVALANGFVATVEGTIAVFKGVGEVAGAALEVAASPEFHNTLNAEMANYNTQQVEQQAYINELNAQANSQAETARQQQEAQQKAKAAQDQAGREALARQLADGIAYRNLQIANTNDAATLQRLHRDNEAALQAAQQIGMHSYVSGMATQSTQASFDQSRAERTAQAQSDQQKIAEQARVRRELEVKQQAEAARAEQQRLAEQARMQREQEAKQRAEEQRLAAERAEQEKKQAWAGYLAAYKRSIRLGAKQCDGKEQPYRLIGDRPPNPLPKIISHYSSCISVQYEARCPSTPRGAGLRSTQYNFTGMGLGCLSAESLMPQRLSCKDEEVIVETLEVTGCS